MDNPLHVRASQHRHWLAGMVEHHSHSSTYNPLVTIKSVVTSWHSFMQRHVHPSFGRVKTIVDGLKYGWMGKKMKEQKTKIFQNHRYCQLCLTSGCKWSHVCVCSPFQVIRHMLKFVNWLNSYHPCVHQNMCDWH